ncbi:hypothetical protein RI129_009513 [Pyrocoelia pectoralis]|uniref:Cation-dependent mannose-6-phosphate receptor n=1 Tax=Pyrocoelia pectoralis TaxID=417401 RepID=A0AAN7V9H5_9COLE
MANLLLKNTIVTALLCILFFKGINSTEDNACIETSLCHCALNDNKYIDLSKLNKSDSNYNVTSLGFTYFFFPCRDVAFDPSPTLPVAKVNNTCISGASLCLYNEANHTLTNLGLASEGKFMNDYPKTLHFTHENKETSIVLECAHDYPDAYLVYSSGSANSHNLILFSMYSCVQMGHPGLSIGSTILILCATIFGVYLLGGAIIMHCLRGARGSEMIPNLDFWSSIPGLVKDGTIFVLGGCNPMVVSNAETYDRI